MDIKSFTNLLGPGWRAGPYPFRKIRKSLEQYPYKNKILHNFHLNVFFSTMDINFFTNGGEGPLWNLSSKNRVTPVSIQDGVQHGTTFAAISTIPAVPSPISAELSPNSAELSPIPEAIGGRAIADRCETR